MWLRPQPPRPTGKNQVRVSVCAPPHTVTRLRSYHRRPDRTPLRLLWDEAPCVTSQETTSTQQATDPMVGRPPPHFSFVPILRPSPLLLTFSLPSTPPYPLTPRSNIPWITASPPPKQSFVSNVTDGHKVSGLADAKHAVETITQETTHPLFPLLLLPSALLHSLLTLTAWDVRLLLDNPRTNRPERRTALVTRELARYKEDIVALGETRLPEQDQERRLVLATPSSSWPPCRSLHAAFNETRFSEQGQHEEVGVGYIFLGNGLPKAERRDAGVDFVLRNDIVGQLSCLPQDISDRFMSLRLPLWEGSVYAPLMTSPDVARNKLYEDLHTLWRLPKAGNLIAFGDFSACVGIDHAA
nr:unnamed protein product [Spirometra erinaceieuropaei]